MIYTQYTTACLSIFLRSLHVYIQANLLCVLFSGNNVMGRSIVLYSTFSVLSIRISETTWTKRVAGSSIQRGKGDQVNIPQLEEIRGRYREETASVSDSLKIFVKKARRGWQYVGTARKSFTNKNVVWNTSVQRRWDPWSLYVPLANSEPCHKWASVTTADRTHCPERPSSNWDHQAEQTKNWQQALDNKFGRIKWIKWITYESHMNHIWIKSILPTSSTSSKAPNCPFETHCHSMLKAKTEDAAIMLKHLKHMCFHLWCIQDKADLQHFWGQNSKQNLYTLLHEPEGISHNQTSNLVNLRLVPCHSLPQIVKLCEILSAAHMNTDSYKYLDICCRLFVFYVLPHGQKQNI